MRKRVHVNVPFYLARKEGNTTRHRERHEGWKGEDSLLARGKRWHLARSSRGWTLDLLLSLPPSLFYIFYCGLTMINPFVAIHKTLGTQSVSTTRTRTTSRQRPGGTVSFSQVVTPCPEAGEAIERTSYWRAGSQLDTSPQGIEYFWTCPLSDGRITGARF